EQDVREISRFSCMLFLSVRGFSDYAGPNSHSRNSVATVLPSSISEGSRHPDPSAFRSSIARPTGTSGLRFTRHLTVPPARLEARMESLFSFPVGLFHPLQHAGLSRRTPSGGQLTRILGHEPVGEIIAVAPDVTTRKVGDRVGTAWIQSTCGRCEWCQRGRRMFCPYLKGTGIEAQGGHAEYMLMNADATYLIPDKVSYEQAAPIFCAGYTVYSGLRWADPKPHERVAVLGIGG